MMFRRSQLPGNGVTEDDDIWNDDDDGDDEKHADADPTSSTCGSPLVSRGFQFPSGGRHVSLIEE